MKNLKKKAATEKRIKSRKSYSGHIFFVAKSGFYEGRLKNYSRHGLFIETKVSLSVGEIITIDLPHVNGTNTKHKGQIIWCTNEGCGIELFQKRNNSSLKIIK